MWYLQTIKKENIMPGLTIISTHYNEAGGPAVKIGMSEYQQEEKHIVTGHELTLKAEIDNQIDDLIRQLEAARKEAKEFIGNGTP